MNILVIGDPIIDEYVYCQSNRFSLEDSSVQILDIERKDYCLGGCLNTAANLKSLGHENNVTVFAPISSFTWNILDKTGVKSLVLLSEDYETGEDFLSSPQSEELLKSRIIKNNKQFIRIDNRLKFDDKTSFYFKKWLLGYDFKKFDFLVVSDYEKGCVDNEIVKKISEFSGPIFIDTKKKDFSIWPNRDNTFFKINFKEWSEAKNWNNLNNLIVTRGFLPVLYYKNGDVIGRCDVEEVENADVCGAGDVFLAGLITEYIKTKNIQESIRFAAKVATISTTKFGTCMVRRDEL